MRRVDMKFSNSPHAGCQDQLGFTLIEALIALLVLSIGLLGVAAMQLKALQGAHAAYQRSIASLAAQDAQERLWSVMSVRIGEVGFLECPSWSSGQESAWQDQWSSFLPGLSSNPVTPLGDCEFEISVSWAEGRFADEVAPVFKYTIRLPGEVTL